MVSHQRGGGGVAATQIPVRWASVRQRGTWRLASLTKACVVTRISHRRAVSSAEAVAAQPLYLAVAER